MCYWMERRIVEIKLNQLRLILLLAVLCAFPVFGDQNKDVRVPTHADAAVIMAKYSGLFDRYIDKNATLTECVSFLNKHGIYFGLMEVVNGAEFTQADCARVMGQMELVFTGEAEYFAGKVKLPKGIATWEEFCIMDGIKYVEGYAGLVQMASVGAD